MARQYERLGRLADESVGMGGVSGIEDGLSRGQDRIGLATVDRGWGEQSQAPVVVLEVLPVEKRGAEIERLVVVVETPLAEFPDSTSCSLLARNRLTSSRTVQPSSVTARGVRPANRSSSCARYLPSEPGGRLWSKVVDLPLDLPGPSPGGVRQERELRIRFLRSGLVMTALLGDTDSFGPLFGISAIRPLRRSSAHPRQKVAVRLFYTVNTEWQAHATRPLLATAPRRVRVTRIGRHLPVGPRGCSSVGRATDF